MYYCDICLKADKGISNNNKTYKYVIIHDFRMTCADDIQGSMLTDYFLVVMTSASMEEMYISQQLSL